MSIKYEGLAVLNLVNDIAKYCENPQVSRVLYLHGITAEKIPEFIKKADEFHKIRCKHRNNRIYRSWIDLLVFRYGLLSSDCKKVTYQTIGDHYGLTKERTRQLFMNILKWLGRHYAEDYL